VLGNSKGRKGVENASLTQFNIFLSRQLRDVIDWKEHRILICDKGLFASFATFLATYSTMDNGELHSSNTARVYFEAVVHSVKEHFIKQGSDTNYVASTQKEALFFEKNVHGNSTWMSSLVNEILRIKALSHNELGKLPIYLFLPLFITVGSVYLYVCRDCPDISTNICP